MIFEKIFGTKYTPSPDSVKSYWESDVKTIEKMLDYSAFSEELDCFVCAIRIDRLAKLTGFVSRTIRKAIVRLEKAGYLKHKRTGRASVYFIARVIKPLNKHFRNKLPEAMREMDLTDIIECPIDGRGSPTAGTQAETHETMPPQSERPLEAPTMPENGIHKVTAENGTMRMPSQLEVQAHETVQNTYGYYKNVSLSNKQMQELVSEFGEQLVHEYIGRVDTYCEQMNKKYPNCAATIRKWIMQDKQRQATAQPQQRQQLHNKNKRFYGMKTYRSMIEELPENKRKYYYDHVFTNQLDEIADRGLDDLVELNEYLKLSNRFHESDTISKPKIE